MTNAELFSSARKACHSDPPSPVAIFGDQVHSQSLLVLPSPSATDVSTLFFGRNSKSHARKQNSDHVPRPRNAFILFRCDFVQQRVPVDVISDHRDLSRLAGYMWRQMTDEQKRPWFEKAEVEKRYHSQAFPTYRYTPGPLNRPKRVYRRKKPPSPQEILLQDPYDLDRRALSCPAGHHKPNTPLHASPSISAYGDGAPHNCCIPHPRPSRDAHHQSPRFPEPNRSPIVDNGQISPLPHSHGPVRAGFLQIPKQEDTTMGSWDFTTSNSTSPYDERGEGFCHWETAPRSSRTRSPNLVYPYSEYSPIPIDPTSPGADSLSDTWKGLETFHNQYTHHHQGTHHQQPDLVSNYYPNHNSHAVNTSHGLLYPHASEPNLEGYYSNRSMKISNT